MRAASVCFGAPFFTANSSVSILKLRHSILSLLLACSSVMLTPVSTAAAKAPAQQELASGSALVIDLKTNEVLYSSNPDVVVPIASVTKLMTAMVALDANRKPAAVPPLVLDTDDERRRYAEAERRRDQRKASAQRAGR